MFCHSNNNTVWATLITKQYLALAETFSVCEMNSSTSFYIHTLVVVSLKLLHTGMMEVLDSAEGSPHHGDMIPDCNGTETDFISCFSPNALNITCDYLLVECRDPVNTEPTATTATTATEATEATDSESDGSGGVSTVAVFAGIGGAIVVIIAMILIITLLIVVILKNNNCRCRYVY